MSRHEFAWIRRDCFRCGAPLLPEQKGLCPDCLPEFAREYGDSRHYLIITFDEGRRRLPVLHLTDYHSRENTMSRRMILEKKGNNLRDLDEFLAGQMARELRRFWQPDPTEDTVVWVPRSARGIARGGMDHVRGLAEALGRACGLPVSPILCRRKRREENDQKDLDGSMRAANARTAFAVRNDRLADIGGKRCILLDDVCTTGATLSACADLLLRYGAADVLALCISASDNSRNSETKQE